MTSAPRPLVAAASAIALLASPALGLEKAARAFADDEPPEWRAAATTCSLVYYNLCFGWVWTWSGWTPNERYGVSFDTCCPGGTNLVQAFLYYWSPAPSGYGFTGSVDVWAADANECPTGPALHSQPHLPAQGWNSISFGPSGAAVPDGFVLTYTVGDAPWTDPHALATDFPASGAAGEPAACGTCYPTTRSVRSFYYGTSTSPLCPGIPFFDGTCDVEFLWDARVACAISVEADSWGKIKAVYR
jgi:hypothetical protein